MPRILVVEDEPAIADTITYALTTEGFEVDWCTTGGEALHRLQARAPELIVLDVGLPDVNGFELCKQIRRTHATPIIFLTARSGEIDRVVGLEIGGDDYVVKPFSPRELTARVKVVLRRAGVQPCEAPAPVPSSSAQPSCGLFEIDSQRMQIRYHGQPLELSRCEFKILETLAGRPGWVFSRQQLLAHAHPDEPTPSLERTIDTHIKTLRGKLREVCAEADPIQTHRGFGYSLKEQP